MAQKGISSPSKHPSHSFFYEEIALFFENFIQCVSSYSPPTPPGSSLPPPNFMTPFNIFDSPFTIVCAIYILVGIHWNVVDLPGATALKKTDSPYPRVTHSWYLLTSVFKLLVLFYHGHIKWSVCILRTVRVHIYVHIYVCWFTTTNHGTMGLLLCTSPCMYVH